MTQHSLALPTRALATPTLRLALPSDETCWQALLRRDRGYNGRFWFSVSTTGVYCLPSCAARRPLRRNVAFHATPADAEAAGFRPCKRCKPTDWQADLRLSKPVARACALFDSADGDTPPSLSEVARRVGLSSGALSKRFVAELGVNPRDWLVARKRQRFRRALREGDSVLAAFSGSTRATCVFFTNFGAAYTCRIIDVPASTGYGEPIQKQFKLKDGERIVGALSLDPRAIGSTGQAPFCSCPTAPASARRTTMRISAAASPDWRTTPRARS